MKITDTILIGYKKLSRKNNNWSFLFEIYGLQTKITVENLDSTYVVYIKQRSKIRGYWSEAVLLGLVKETTDLEQLFFSITRGEKLN